MPGKKTWAKKGFVAVDLDGTALIQRIDKQKIYGLRHPRSDLRQSLIQYLKMAQANGYDLVIMTARLELIENALLVPGRGRLGTKPTEDILLEFQKAGIMIDNIIRVPPRGLKEGLKGSAMQQLWQEYIQHGAKDAEGILFDDQLKQTEAVKHQKNSKLVAYDINSSEDRSRFMEKMGGIVEEIQGSTSDIGKKITLLETRINEIDKNNYEREVIALKKILHNLKGRLKEVEECNYQPDIDWVRNAVGGVSTLVNKLTEKTILLRHEDITHLSLMMLNHPSPALFIPNSKCERTMKKLLLYMERLPALDDIKNQCMSYLAHLEHEIDSKQKSRHWFWESSSEKAVKKLEIVTSLINALNQDTNPTKALKAFYKIYQENKEMLQSSRSGKEFVKNIRRILASIPLIGHLFKIHGEKLVDSIERAYAKPTFSNPKMG